MAEFDQHKAIPILFNYIGEYEYGRKFETNEFVNYFEGVVAHLTLVRDQNKLAIVKGVDDTLLMELDRVPFTSPKGNTDVRYFTAHLLATAFPIIIPMAAQFQQAYRFCTKLRQHKADIDFLELELAEHLLDRNLLKKNPDLRLFFLTKIAEIQNLNHDPNVLDEPSYQTLDRLGSIAPGRLLLALRRRNLTSSPGDLMQDRRSPEYKLSEFKILSNMSASNPIYHGLLLEMGYLKTRIPFLGQVRQFFATFFRFIFGVFRTPRYVWFVLTKGRAGAIFYLTVLLAAIALLFSVFNLLGAYKYKKWMEFSRHIEQAKKQ